MLIFTLGFITLYLLFLDFIGRKTIKRDISSYIFVDMYPPPTRANEFILPNVRQSKEKHS